jgi:hypothetical protein
LRINMPSSRLCGGGVSNKRRAYFVNRRAFSPGAFRVEHFIVSPLFVIYKTKNTNGRKRKKRKKEKI